MPRKNNQEYAFISKDPWRHRLLHLVWTRQHLDLGLYRKLLEDLTGALSDSSICVVLYVLSDLEMV